MVSYNSVTSSFEWVGVFVLNYYIYYFQYSSSHYIILWFRARSRYLSLSTEDGEDVEEEADAVVPDGVEEVELERVNLEKKERILKLLLDDIMKLSLRNNGTVNHDSEKDDNLGIVTGGTAALVRN